MSRKHFVRLAAALASTKPLAEPHPGALQTWRATVDEIADACAASNSNFDRERFLRACGVGS